MEAIASAFKGCPLAANYELKLIDLPLELTHGAFRADATVRLSDARCSTHSIPLGLLRVVCNLQAMRCGRSHGLMSM
eukprot:2746014-Amphidinium_carterae.1